jgi:hypothetical protein
MIAYAPTMGFLDSLRNALTGPPRIRGSKGEAAEVSATFHEEYSVPAPEQESKAIEQADVHSDELAAPAGTAPFGAGTFASPATADLGPERDAELDEPLETLEAESDPEEKHRDS